MLGRCVSCIARQFNGISSKKIGLIESLEISSIRLHYKTALLMRGHKYFSSKASSEVSMGDIKGTGVEYN